MADKLEKFCNQNNLTPTVISLACIILIAGILIIAGSSIGIDCYIDENKSNPDKSKTLKYRKGSNFNFMIVNIICGILLLLSASSAFAMVYSRSSNVAQVAA